MSSLVPPFLRSKMLECEEPAASSSSSSTSGLPAPTSQVVTQAQPQQYYEIPHVPGEGRFLVQAKVYTRPNTTPSFQRHLAKFRREVEFSSPGLLTYKTSVVKAEGAADAENLICHELYISDDLERHEGGRVTPEDEEEDDEEEEDGEPSTLDHLQEKLPESGQQALDKARAAASKASDKAQDLAEAAAAKVGIDPHSSSSSSPPAAPPPPPLLFPRTRRQAEKGLVPAGPGAQRVQLRPRRHRRLGGRDARLPHRPGQDAHAEPAQQRRRRAAHVQELHRLRPQVFQREGAKGFYRGLGPQLIVSPFRARPLGSSAGRSANDSRAIFCLSSSSPANET